MKLSLDGKKKWWNKEQLLEEIKHNYLMSEKYKTYKYLNYVENLLILVSPVTCCVPISAFASLVYVPVGMTGSAVGLNIYHRN